MSIQLIPYKPAGTIGSGPYVLREYKPDTGIDISALSITYTGAYTDYGMVTMSDGARYRLLAFTASGTLSIEQPVNCEVCVVGGGANGSNGSFNTGGGAGAYMKNQVIEAFESGAVVVGAAQGASSIGGVSVAAVVGINGGTGAGSQRGGTGDGLSKYPFSDDSYELWGEKPHCAGGGAGGIAKFGSRYIRQSYSYGDGGSNGSNGSAQTFREYGQDYAPDAPGGSGGLYGGGNGGTSFGESNGANATYYGSGGGAGGYYYSSDDIGNGGSGYQGIVYIRIPEEQAA